MKILQEYDLGAGCSKCGFRPIVGDTNRKWKLEYKENDYSCDWEDPDVDEHLHMTCPVCGYEVIMPCKDYESKKNNSWSVEKEEEQPRVFTPNLTSTTKVPNHLPLNNKKGWNVEEEFCKTCPVSK